MAGKEYEGEKLSRGFKPQTILRLSVDIFYNLKFAFIVVVIMATLYIFYRIRSHTGKRYNCNNIARVRPQQRVGTLGRLFVIPRSIISHQQTLSNLEYAADNCNEVQNALTCINMIVCYPSLMNVKSKNDGMTPFHRVCLQGHTSLMEFMLAYDADPFITTNDERDALHMAIYHLLCNQTKTDFSCLNVLMQAGCKLRLTQWYTMFLRTAIANNHTMLIRWLLLHRDTNPHTLQRSITYS